MDLAGEYTFEAPQELVWKALRDPEVLGSVMPGGQGFEETAENQYAGDLKIRVGPVQGVFKGEIKLTDVVEPESYAMEVNGKGAPGFVRATGTLRLTAVDDRTHMAYEGSAQIGGRIASVGQRLLDASAKSIIRQSLEGLNDYLKIEAAAMTAAGTAEDKSGEEPEMIGDAPSGRPEYEPPSQTEVAINVAKDVAGDLIPPKYRPAVIGAIIILILVVAYVALT